MIETTLKEAEQYISAVVFVHFSQLCAFRRHSGMMLSPILLKLGNTCNVLCVKNDTKFLKRVWKASAKTFMSVA